MSVLDPTTIQGTASSLRHIARLAKHGMEDMGARLHAMQDKEEHARKAWHALWEFSKHLAAVQPNNEEIQRLWAYMELSSFPSYWNPLVPGEEPVEPDEPSETHISAFVKDRGELPF
jgi:hypothetical protein